MRFAAKSSFCSLRYINTLVHSSSTDILLHHRQTIMEEELPGMLRIPRELRIQILSHLIRQDDTIIMREGKISREKRRWNAEIEKLKDPNWKRPRNGRFHRVLQVCRELYICGVKAFWGGNTFSFETLDDLQKFIDLSSAMARDSIKKIDLFTKVGPHVPGEKPRAPWTGRKPTLALLSALPDLKSVHMATDHSSFASRFYHLGNEEVLDWRFGKASSMDAQHVRHFYPPHHDRWPRKILYGRDALLKSIPKATVDQLETFTVRCWSMQKERVTDVEILDYIRDIQSGVWDRFPQPEEEEHEEENLAWTLEREQIYGYDATRDDGSWCSWSGGLWSRKHGRSI